jgi:hypothetical protein
MTAQPRASLTLEELPEIYWDLVEHLDDMTQNANIVCMPTSGTDYPDDNPWVGMNIYRTHPDAGSRRVSVYNDVDNDTLHIVVLDHQSVTLAEATFTGMPASLIATAIIPWLF